MYSRIQLTKNHLAKSGTERFREYVRTKMEEIKMAKDKKMVEAITSMEEDFAQWYTDVGDRFYHFFSLYASLTY